MNCMFCCEYVIHGTSSRRNMFIIVASAAAAALLMLVLALAHALSARERLRSPRELSKIDQYQSAQLTHGATAFRYHQPTQQLHNTVVVVIHGATIGSLAYTPHAKALAANGFECLTYDQYGRGFSERQCSTPINMRLLCEQLRELIDHCGLQRVALYGISLGGAVAVSFAAAHPERVVAVGYLVPLIASPPPTALPFWQRLMLQLLGIPLLGAWLARVVMVPAIISRGEAIGASDTSADTLSIKRHFVEQFDVVGTCADIRSLLLSDAVHGNRLAEHATVASRELPALFQYASDDPEIPRATVEEAIALSRSPSPPAVSVWRGGHFFSEGKEAELVAELCEFLRAHGL